MTLADIRVGLRALLLANAAISPAVGASRVYPLVLPQGTTATSIVYSRISGIGDHHSTGPSGLARPRFQVDCWATTHNAAAALALLVKECLDGYQGSVQWDDNSPGNAIEIQGIFFDSERENYDSEAKLYRVSHDYFVWYEER